jgi:hypothetical protein
MYKDRGENVMNNKMIKLLVAVAGLLLMSPLAFAGSEPAPPSANLVDGRPVINRVMLTLSPSSVTCGGSGVDCGFGDLMIVGKCKGVIISAMLENQNLIDLGLDFPNEDITDIVEEGIEGRFFEGLGDALAFQNPNLDQNKCPVSGRDYQVQKVQKFVNDSGVVSAVIRLVPKD